MELIRGTFLTIPLQRDPLLARNVVETTATLLQIEEQEQQPCLLQVLRDHKQTIDIGILLRMQLAVSIRINLVVALNKNLQELGQMLLMGRRTRLGQIDFILQVVE
jgi:hypothetical protein